MWFEACLARAVDPDDESECLLLACRDIGDRKWREHYLQRMAFSDPLTGIANRRRLMDRLNEATGAEAVLGERFALLYFDIDRFKAINDRLGHEAGDELLELFARRVEGNLRPEDVFARIGGDEFVVLLARVDAPQALDVAERLCDALQGGWSLRGGTLVTSSSIGVALFPEAARDAHGLLRCADQALYEAKRAGRGCVRLHQPTN